MSKPVRRDVVKRLVLDGRVVLTESHHFDDMTGDERKTFETPLPVAITQAGQWRERKDGVCYLFESDFTSKTGWAQRFTDAKGRDRITFVVHSNSSYDFVVLPKAAPAPPVTAARVVPVERPSRPLVIKELRKLVELHVAGGSLKTDLLGLVDELAAPTAPETSQPTLASPTCPGCSGTGVPLQHCPTVLRCANCGGLFTAAAIPRATAVALVGLDRPMAAWSKDQFYFDFDITESGRVHGWADRLTGTVVQYG